MVMKSVAILEKKNLEFHIMHKNKIYLALKI